MKHSTDLYHAVYFDRDNGIVKMVAGNWNEQTQMTGPEIDALRRNLTMAGWTLDGDRAERPETTEISRLSPRFVDQSKTYWRKFGNSWGG